MRFILAIICLLWPSIAVTQQRSLDSANARSETQLRFCWALKADSVKAPSGVCPVFVRRVHADSQRIVWGWGTFADTLSVSRTYRVRTWWALSVPGRAFWSCLAAYRGGAQTDTSCASWPSNAPPPLPLDTTLQAATSPTATVRVANAAGDSVWLVVRYTLPPNWSATNDSVRVDYQSPAGTFWFPLAHNTRGAADSVKLPVGVSPGQAQTFQGMIFTFRLSPWTGIKTEHLFTSIVSWTRQFAKSPADDSVRAVVVWPDTAVKLARGQTQHYCAFAEMTDGSYRMMADTTFALYLTRVRPYCDSIGRTKFGLRYAIKAPALPLRLARRT